MPKRKIDYDEDPIIEEDIETLSPKRKKQKSPTKEDKSLELIEELLEKLEKLEKSNEEFGKILHSLIKKMK